MWMKFRANLLVVVYCCCCFVDEYRATSKHRKWSEASRNTASVNLKIDADILYVINDDLASNRR